MIQGVHALFYSSKPEELRAFLRDKLQLPYTDVGERQSHILRTRYST